MSCVWMLQRGHSGDGCVLASTLCKYDLRKGDLFVLSWARVQRVRRGSLSSELLVCGGGVRSILLLPLVARCLETIDVCIWRMFDFMSVVAMPSRYSEPGMCVSKWPPFGPLITDTLTEHSSIII